MSAAETVDDVESIGAIMAELKADARTLSQDLVRGIEAYRHLALRHALLGIFAAIMAAFLYVVIYQLSFAPDEIALLTGNVLWGSFATAIAVLAVVEIIAAYTTRRMYSAMRRKYSGLVEIWARLGG